MAEHISGRPVPSEVSLHEHVATKENFKALSLINNLQLEVSRKQTLNLSTHLAVFELLAYWLQVGDFMSHGVIIG